MPSIARQSIARKALAAGAALALLTPVFAPQHSMAQHAKAPVTLIFWQWVTGADKAVALYNKTHPGVQVIMRNVGAGTPEYNKLTTAYKAGTGAPDLAQIEFQYLPQFEASGGLLDMGKYGANSFKSQFVPWTWSQVTVGSSVYAIPQDTGPTALFYRADLFKKYNLTVPKTWDQYAADAAKLHAANKNAYISNFDTADGGHITSFIWQAGGRLFTRTGNNWRVTIDNPAAVKVANYWNDLVSKGLLKLEPDFTADLYSDWTKGNVLTRVSAVWDQGTLRNNVPKTAGNWRVAPLPQWSASGKFVAGNWGGSTTVVSQQTKHPKEATDFATWLNTNQQAYAFMIKGNGLWPADNAILKGMDAIQGADPFFGGQHVAQTFATASAAVDVNFAWGPEMSFTYAKLQDNFTTAAHGQGTFAAALSKTQKQVVGFMNTQGFTVSG